MYAVPPKSVKATDVILIGERLLGESQSHAAAARALTLEEQASLGFVGLLCLAAKTPDQALEHACRFSLLWCDRELTVERTVDTVTVTSPIASETNQETPREAMALLVSVRRLLECAGAGAIGIEAAAGPPGAQAVLRASLSCPVAEAPHALSMRLLTADLQRPNPSADERLHDVLTRHAEQRLTERASRHSVVERVRRALVGLSGSEARAYVVAAQLGLGVRSLHRRLRAEGTTFREVLDALRMERCMHELQSSVTAKHVAESLGFA